MRVARKVHRSSQCCQEDFALKDFPLRAGYFGPPDGGPAWVEHNPVSLELLHIDMSGHSLNSPFSGAVLHDGLGVMLGKTQASGDIGGTRRVDVDLLLDRSRRGSGFILAKT